MEEFPIILNTSDTIKQLYESDQHDRTVLFVHNPTKGAEIFQRDQERLKQAKEILHRQTLTDPQELNMLAYIFQHGSQLEDYKTALDLTTKAVASGLPPELSLIPQATDRIMIQEQLDKGVHEDKLKQKFGTQMRFDQDGNPFTPTVDGTATQEELQKFGLNKNNAAQ